MLQTMKGQRVLEQVIRTQAELSAPDFDLGAVLREVVDEARALTGAEAAVVETPRGEVFASGPKEARGHALVVPLPQRRPAAGALRVYGADRRPFTHEDVQALELLAALIGAALTRAELTPHSAAR
jgi:signal transduction protein with GAF and PtsI domain